MSQEPAALASGYTSSQQPSTSYDPSFGGGGDGGGGGGGESSGRPLPPELQPQRVERGMGNGGGGGGGVPTTYNPRVL